MMRDMGSSTRQCLVWGIALVIGLAAGCAGKRGASQSPDACMRTCDDENCAYAANGSGDNAEYLDCLEACEQSCSS